MIAKVNTMFGRDDKFESFGVAPMSIYWLFKLIDDYSLKHGNKFTIKVSAVEICGKDEKLIDLLGKNRPKSVSDKNQNDRERFAPRISDRLALADNSLLNSLSEYKATNAQKAIYYLDLALNSRTSNCTLFLPYLDYSCT